MSPRERAPVHVVAGGFPPGMPAGHDHDYARLRILKLLEEMDAPATVNSDFSDIDRWLRGTRFLITYVAGPHPNEQQDGYIREWLESGGRWLGLHGTSGGRAVRVGEDGRRRAMAKGPHHETLGGFFINHPPVRRFQVDVASSTHPLTKGLPTSFEVIDEPYMIELQQPEACDILLTAELGPDTSPPGFGFVYEKDTALMPDGRTRVLGFAKEVGRGGVAYVALGHCHTPWSNSQPFVDASVDPDGKTPPVLRHTWEQPAFQQLLRNALAWGLARE